jgi:hypothetical protein
MTAGGMNALFTLNLEVPMLLQVMPLPEVKVLSAVIDCVPVVAVLALEVRDRTSLLPAVNGICICPTNKKIADTIRREVTENQPSFSCNDEGTGSTVTGGGTGARALLDCKLSAMFQCWPPGKQKKFDCFVMC